VPGSLWVKQQRIFKRCSTEVPANEPFAGLPGIHLVGGLLVLVLVLVLVLLLLLVVAAAAVAAVVVVNPSI